jgi:hypothetical protein
MKISRAMLFDTRRAAQIGFREAGRRRGAGRLMQVLVAKGIFACRPKTRDVSLLHHAN